MYPLDLTKSEYYAKHDMIIEKICYLYGNYFSFTMEIASMRKRIEIQASSIDVYDDYPINIYA